MESCNFACKWLLLASLSMGLSGCSLGISIPVFKKIQERRAIESYHPIVNQHDREDFNTFLGKVDILLAKHYGSNPYPKAFISYAWEDMADEEGQMENRALQDRLLTLQEDLEYIGIRTFIDLKYMHGDMRQTMKQNLEDSDFIILIGTPRLKKKCSLDRLMLLPYFDPSFVQNAHNIVALVSHQDDYIVYYTEAGAIKEIFTVPMSSLDISKIDWFRRDSLIEEGYLGEKTNRFLEEIFKKIKSREHKFVSNVQFEFGIALDKSIKNPASLMPLLFKGNIIDSFPLIIENSFVRDFRNEDDYNNQMMSLTNPLGVIGGICPSITRNEDYMNIVKEFKR